MFSISSLRRAGALLFLGVVLFSAATIAAEPFEQETAIELYQAIAQNGKTYQIINYLALLGFVMVIAGVLHLILKISQIDRRLKIASMILLGVAALLWLAEIIGRLTITTNTASQIGQGAVIPARFPANLGVGLEPLFVAFMATTLGGLAVWLWQLGQVNLLSKRVSRASAFVVIVSGTIAALTYPWVGGVERALFYPFVLVLLPLSIFLLAQRAPRPAPILP